MLREGESLIKQPGIVDLNKSDVDANADFVLAVARTSHPQHPGSLSGAHLGPPIAMTRKTTTLRNTPGYARRLPAVRAHTHRTAACCGRLAHGRSQTALRGSVDARVDV